MAGTARGTTGRRAEEPRRAAPGRARAGVGAAADRGAGAGSRAAADGERGAPSGGALRGTLQTLAIVAAFVAGGLGAGGWAGARADVPRGPAYTGGAMVGDPSQPDEATREAPEPAATRWLVDGFNVLHVGLLGGRDRSGWWREEGRARVLAHAARFAAADAEVWVVFDGPQPAGDPGHEGRVRIVFAPSADDWLLREVRLAPEPARLVVVTADRKLGDRARHRGARVEPPAAFLARCADGPPVPG